MFKEILHIIWGWFRSKTTVDEKAIEVVDEIKVRSVLVKKELKDVVDAVKGVPAKPKKKYYKPKAKAESKK